MICKTKIYVCSFSYEYLVLKPLHKLCILVVKIPLKFHIHGITLTNHTKAYDNLALTLRGFNST